MINKGELYDMLERWYNERDGFTLCSNKDCPFCDRIWNVIKDTKKLLREAGRIK